MDSIILIVCFIGIIWSIISLIRNEQVCKFRRKVITVIYAQDNWDELRKILDNPTYNTMVLKFWIPLRVEKWYSEEFVKIYVKYYE